MDERELKRKAEAGDAEAQYRLAELYDRRAGAMWQCPPEAEVWYRKAAEQGVVEAMFRISGKSTAMWLFAPEKDKLEFTIEVAKTGNFRAIHMLAEWCANGEMGLKQKMKKAIGLYERAAKLGDKTAIARAIVTLMERGLI